MIIEHTTLTDLIRRRRPGYVISNDYALLTRFTPVSPLETELELTWLVRDDADEGRDYDPDAVCWLWRVTAGQDKTICENNQRGILSSRYQPGPYATTESSVDEFVSWYLRELQPHSPAGTLQSFATR